MDFTYCRTWAGWVYVAFIVDVYSQKIVAWHAQTTKHIELVMIPVAGGAVGTRPRRPPIQPKQLQAHSDAGSQYVSLAYTEKLALDGGNIVSGNIAIAQAAAAGDAGPVQNEVNINCGSWPEAKE